MHSVDIGTASVAVGGEEGWLPFLLFFTYVCGPGVDDDEPELIGVGRREVMHLEKVKLVTSLSTYKTASAIFTVCIAFANSIACQANILFSFLNRDGRLREDNIWHEHLMY